MLKVTVLGATGRMGKAVKENIGNFASIALEVSSLNPDEYIECDVVVDYSRPHVITQYLESYPKHLQKPIVISGTTGFSEDEMKKFHSFGRDFAIFWASNTSFGVNLLKSAVRLLASKLPANLYDAEVLEKHHKHKVDSPSGTAITLGKAIADGRNQDFESSKVIDRSGKRREGDIGFAVQRSGEIIGYHEINFVNDHDRIFIGHEAFDRSIFARGAIEFAHLACKAQKPNGFYDASSLLDI